MIEQADLPGIIAEARGCLAYAKLRIEERNFDDAIEWLEYVADHVDKVHKKLIAYRKGVNNAS